MPMNAYFELAEPQAIADVQSLVSLNVEKTYYRPGEETRVDDVLGTYSLPTSISMYSMPHTTSGIFRGQLNDWPLVPKSLRGIEDHEMEATGVVRSFHFERRTSQFRSFCERAEVQNPAFPSNVSARMSIAQHFGVPTPLLDWSQNILTAVFFAIRDVYADSTFENSLKVFVYHVIDERLLHAGIPDDSDLADFGQSAFVKPYPIDRRIERQQGVFTYHPHPSHRPPTVSARKYVLEWPLIESLLPLMKGFGFTEDYFFPDYAGIAHAIMSNTSL